ncbi:unnamed protein product [Lampetra planeri]
MAGVWWRRALGLLAAARGRLPPPAGCSLAPRPPLPSLRRARGGAALWALGALGAGTVETARRGLMTGPEADAALQAHGLVASAPVSVGPSPPEMRFLEFASLQLGEQMYMTPLDFLDSVTSDTASWTSRKFITKKEADRLLKNTPKLKEGSLNFFTSQGHRGMLSYTDYLFLVCILTKPRAGFQVFFKMFDTDGNERVDKKEFMKLLKIFRKKKEKSTNSLEETTEVVGGAPPLETTLVLHLFKDQSLSYQEFEKFMVELQGEVLRREFEELARGTGRVTQREFASAVLRYTGAAHRGRRNLDSDEGITFEEYRAFFQFLNNLEDFTIAVQMYTRAGLPIGPDEFRRAVLVVTGSPLSARVTRVVFSLFDANNDGRLSQAEFIGVMRERLHRGFKSVPSVGRSGYVDCVKRDMVRGLQEFRRMYQKA